MNTIADSEFYIQKKITLTEAVGFDRDVSLALRKAVAEFQVEDARAVAVTLLREALAARGFLMQVQDAS